jgi:hypothetical protein
LCQGGSKRYFSCNIQVGDGPLNKHSVYIRLMQWYLSNVTVLELNFFFIRNLDGSFFFTHQLFKFSDQVKDCILLHPNKTQIMKSKNICSTVVLVQISGLSFSIFFFH